MIKSRDKSHHIQLNDDKSHFFQSHKMQDIYHMINPTFPEDCAPQWCLLVNNNPMNTI